MTLHQQKVHKCVYNIAVAQKVIISKPWSKTSQADADWFSRFLKHCPTLTIWSPQTTSLVQTTSFNRENAGMFFDNQEQIMLKYRFELNNLWNEAEGGDRSKYGSFKKYANSARDAWMLPNIILRIVAISFPIAATPTNIQYCSG